MKKPKDEMFKRDKKRKRIREVLNTLQPPEGPYSASGERLEPREGEGIDAAVQKSEGAITGSQERKRKRPDQNQIVRALRKRLLRRQEEEASPEVSV